MLEFLRLTPNSPLGTVKFVLKAGHFKSQMAFVLHTFLFNNATPSFVPIGNLSKGLDLKPVPALILNRDSYLAVFEFEFPTCV